MGTKFKLFYWWAPVLGLILQVVVLSPVLYFAVKGNSDVGMAALATFIVFGFWSLFILGISYLLLWAIGRYRSRAKGLLGILMVLDALIWVFIFYKMEFFATMPVYYNVLCLLWSVGLYCTPIYLATRSYIFKGEMIAEHETRVTKYQLFYWWSPVVGVILQTAVWLPVLHYAATQENPYMVTVFTSLLWGSCVLCISYLLLWAIERFRTHTTLLLGILMGLYVLIWMGISYRMDLFVDKSLYYSVLCFIGAVALYGLPVYWATRYYVLKNR